MRIVNMKAFLESVRPASGLKCLPIEPLGSFNLYMGNTHIINTNNQIAEIKQAHQAGQISDEQAKLFIKLNERLLIGQSDARDIMMETDAHTAILPDLEGYPVLSCNAGKVVCINDGIRPGDEIPFVQIDNDFLENPFGNFVVIKHKDEYIIYAHLQTRSIRVKPGQGVVKKQQIGNVGNTGNSSHPHLHFGAYYENPIQKVKGIYYSNPYAKGKILDGFEPYQSRVIMNIDNPSQAYITEVQTNTSGRLNQHEYI